MISQSLAHKPLAPRSITRPNAHVGFKIGAGVMPEGFLSIKERAGSRPILPRQDGPKRPRFVIYPATIHPTV